MKRAQDAGFDDDGIEICGEADELQTRQDSPRATDLWVCPGRVRGEYGGEYGEALALSIKAS